MGGNRSGKTELMIAMMAGQLTGQIPARPLAPRLGGWVIYVVSQTQDKQREVVQEKISRYLPTNMIKRNKRGEPLIYQTRGIWDFLELVDPSLDDPQLLKYPKRNLHGARIYFKSYEEKVTGFEGSSVDAAYCDEEPPENIYEAIDARLLDRRKAGNGWFACAMTPDPDNGLTWTYDEIVEKDGENPDRLLIYMSTYDNAENIGKEEIQKLEMKYKDTTRRARIYGLHVSREGFVLDKFKPHHFPDGNIIDPIKPDWRFYTPYESTDWGYKHPWHWGFYAISPDGEYIKYDEIHQERLTVPQMKALVRAKRKYYGYEEPALVVGDPSMARPFTKGNIITSVLDELAEGADQEEDREDGRTDYERGKNVWIGDDDPSPNRNHPNYIWYPIFIKPAKNDRDSGWRKLNERMDFPENGGRPGWFVTSNCVNTIREAKHLQWPPDNNKRVNKLKEIARKRKDDSCDADRYASNEDFIFLDDYDPKSVWYEDTDEDINEYKKSSDNAKKRKKGGKYEEQTPHSVTGY